MDYWNQHEVQHKTDGLGQDYSRETYGKDQKRRKPAAQLLVRPNHALLQHEGKLRKWSDRVALKRTTII